MRAFLTLTGLSCLVGAMSPVAYGQSLTVEIELPTLDVAEYHRPYVAVWVARPDHQVAANLAVWYQLEDGPEGEGETWLKDMRQWWRRTGRSLDMPVDGVSRPTRAPGVYTDTYTVDGSALADLAPGDYVLHVEAAREVGGRELVRIPFTWDEAQIAAAQGESELGKISLTLNP